MKVSGSKIIGESKRHVSQRLIFKAFGNYTEQVEEAGVRKGYRTEVAAW